MGLEAGVPWAKEAVGVKYGVEECVEDEGEEEAYSRDDMFVVDLVEPAALESNGADISAISASVMKSSRAMGQSFQRYSQQAKADRIQKSRSICSPTSTQCHCHLALATF